MPRVCTQKLNRKKTRDRISGFGSCAAHCLYTEIVRLNAAAVYIAVVICLLTMFEFNSILKCIYTRMRVWTSSGRLDFEMKHAQTHTRCWRTHTRTQTTKTRKKIPAVSSCQQSEKKDRSPAVPPNILMLSGSPALARVHFDRKHLYIKLVLLNETLMRPEATVLRGHANQARADRIASTNKTDT